MFSDLRYRLRSLFRRPEVERELDAELHEHLDRQAEVYTRAGLRPDEALRRARLALGGLEQVREECRDARGISWIEATVQDLRYALRTLRKSPMFTVAAVTTLAIGIGANSAIFSVVEAVILRPLPYKDPSHLALLDSGATLTDVAVWKSDSRSFEDIAVYYRGSQALVMLTNENEPELILGGFVAANFFPIMGVAPVVGQWFSQDDERRREPVILLSYGLWLHRFAGSLDVVGKTVRMDGIIRQVIGVMPSTFQFPDVGIQFWAPITTNRSWGEVVPANPNLSRYAYARWDAVARLRPGVSIEHARAEMGAINASLERAAPDRNRADVIRVEPLGAEVKATTRLALFVLSGAVLCLLLIACSNVANLVLARSAARQRELALRTALGAGRGRLARQLLTEGIVLAAIAAALGLVLAVFATRAVVTFGPADIPRLDQAGMDLGVLVFTVAISFGAAITLGVVPSWNALGADPSESLKTSSRGTTPATGVERTQRVLIVLECGLSVMLLVGAGLLVRSFLAVEAVDPGFRPEGVVTMRITLPPGTPVTRRVTLDRATLDHVRAIPGIQAVGAISALFEGQPGSFGLRSVDGHSGESQAQWGPLTWNTVRGDYFQAMGLRLVRGRFFTEADDAVSPLVAIVDETVARRYWPAEDPVGKRFKGFDARGRNDEWLTVIGVVPDMRRHGVERELAGHVYEWYKQATNNPTPDLVVRASADLNGLASSLRRAVRDLDAGAILSAPTSVEQRLSDQLSARRFQTLLLGSFSLVAFFLANLGMYGLTHYAVSQRRTEIGVRMALGAQPGAVVRMVIGRSLWLAGIGLVVGLVGAWWVTRLLSNLLFGVRPLDPTTFGVVGLSVLVVAGVASSIPAWRAVRRDPLSAVRRD
jgi:predicted permease